jgi:hypothetical protein
MFREFSCASLSAKGMQLTRNIMRLNETLAELTGLRIPRRVAVFHHHHGQTLRH